MDARETKPALLRGLALLLVLLLAACNRAPEATPPPAPAAALRLAIDLWPGYYPAVLADELGYFEARGLDVQISVPGNTDRMLAEFAADQHDLVAVALGDLINLSRTRPDVVVMLVSDESAGGDALLQRAGYTAGAGLRIGTNLGGFGELFVREYLQRRAIDPQAVEWVNIDASDVPPALAEGRIDLGHCWEPYASQALAAGALKVFSSAETPGLVPDVIATTRDLVARRAVDLRRFSAAWFEALDWWLAHPEQGNARIEQRLQLAPGSIGLAGIRLLDLEANRRALGARGPAGLAPTIARYSEFFVARGSLARPVAADRLLESSLLP